jgi:intracellular septation protein A
MAVPPFRTITPEEASAPRMLWNSGKFLLLDLASTFFFLALVLITENIRLAIAGGIALGVAQILWQLVRKKPIDTMQWLSLFLVVASGSAALLTDDPRFVMMKPSIIYLIVGVVMLKPGWMTRYMPQIARETVADMAVVFGYVWSVLMFASAALNVFVAWNYDPVTWGWVMSIWGTASKAFLFLIQFVTMRMIGRRRYLARASLMAA